MNNSNFLEDLNLKNNNIELFESFQEILFKIFQYYCSLGEPMNTFQLKSLKFKRMLIDANIIEVIKLNF